MPFEEHRRGAPNHALSLQLVCIKAKGFILWGCARTLDAEWHIISLETSLFSRESLVFATLSRKIAVLVYGIARKGTRRLSVMLCLIYI